MAVTNIAQGANKSIAFLGLKEMQAKLKVIRTAMVSDEAGAVATAGAQVVSDQIVANAEAVNLPHDALLDVYVYGRQPEGEGRSLSVSALAGLRKAGRNKDAHGYRTWYPRNQVGNFPKANRTRKKGGTLVLPGTTNKSGGLQKIGENLATMWEFGTTKFAARPFFRPAIAAVRNNVLSVLADGYRAILEKYAA